MQLFVGDIIKDTLFKINNIVSSTYGPEGNTVIITDKQNNPYTTKDGVSVTRSLWFDNPYENYIAQIIKQVAEKTLEEAGDGTTTSIVLTDALVQTGLELYNKGISYNDIKSSLEYLEKHVIEYIEKNSKKLKTKEELYNVALIASNNDKQIAETVTEAYNHSNIVKVEPGNSFEDKVNKINGMKLTTTYFDSAFVNDLSSKSIIYDKSQVILIGGKLQSLDKISSIISRDKPCIIIAEDFNEDVVLLLKRNHNKGVIKVALVKSPGMGQHRVNLMSDIADYTGASILDENKKYQSTVYTGEISGLEVSKDYCLLFNNNTNPRVSNKIKQLEKYAKKKLNKHELELTKERIEGLKGFTSVIEVGGNSPIEMKERLDRIDDAVRAIGCALEEGITKGGGTLLYKFCIDKNPTKTPYLELSECLKTPYCILNTKNSVFDVNKKQIDEIDDNVIDPIKVIRTALQNAISVSKTLLNTKSIILDKEDYYRWKK